MIAITSQRFEEWFSDILVSQYPRAMVMVKAKNWSDIAHGICG